MKLKKTYIFVAAFMLSATVSCNNQKSADEDSDSAEVVEENVKSDADEIRQVVERWNTSLNNRDEDESRKVYADEVFFYTRDVSGAEATKLRIDLASKDPSWHQSIVTKIKVSDMGDGQFEASFTKESNSDKGTHSYPAYLYLEKIGGKWKITRESDKVTDKNVAKRKAGVPKDAIRGDFDGDGSIDYLWIEGRYDSDGYATGPLKLRSDNPKLEGLKWNSSRGVLLFNLGDLNNSNRDFLGCIPCNDSSWTVYEVYGSKNNKWVKPISPFGVWLGDEDYDRVWKSGRKGYVVIKTNNMADPDGGFDPNTAEVKFNW